MKLISGLIKLEILVHNFFVCLVETFGATHAPLRNLHLVIPPFSEIMNQINRVPEVSLNISKTCQLITFLGNINFEFVSF